MAVHSRGREEELRKQVPQSFQCADLISCVSGGWFGVVRLEQMGCRPAPALGVPAVESGIVCSKRKRLLAVRVGKSDVDVRGDVFRRDKGRETNLPTK